MSFGVSPVNYSDSDPPTYYENTYNEKYYNENTNNENAYCENTCMPIHKNAYTQTPTSKNLHMTSTN